MNDKKCYGKTERNLILFYIIRLLIPLAFAFMFIMINRFIDLFIISSKNFTFLLFNLYFILFLVIALLILAYFEHVRRDDYLRKEKNRPGMTSQEEKIWNRIFKFLSTAFIIVLSAILLFIILSYTLSSTRNI